MRFFLKKNGALPPLPGQLTTPMKLMVAIGPPHGMAVFNIYIYCQTILLQTISLI